jgi:hypothetical protein
LIVDEPLASTLEELRAAPGEFLGRRCERSIVDEPVASTLEELRRRLSRFRE